MRNIAEKSFQMSMKCLKDKLLLRESFFRKVLILIYKHFYT